MLLEVRYDAPARPAAGRRPGLPAWKRAFDACAAAALLVALAPPLALAMLVIRLGSPGPALYRQVRVGRGGRNFTMIKLRTMAADAERKTGAVWAAGADDPRVAGPGRFLRRTHLDEVPQLWNILKGEMSFVGPRPERPEIVERLAAQVAGYRGRLDVAPGLTGLAQVQIPPDSGLATVRAKVALDLDYARDLGPGLDARLLICTGLFLVGIPFPTSCRLLGVPGPSAAGPAAEAGPEGEPVAAASLSGLRIGPA